MRIDTKTIPEARAPTGKLDHIEWDEDLAGFGLRLRQGGKRVRRSYVVQYRPSGSRRTRKVTLGTIEKLTPTEAREAARKLLARVALGQDPQHEREVQRAQEERTFRAAVEAYLAAKRPELRPISYRIAKLYLDGAYFRPLHPLAVNTITHPDIAARLSAIAHKHSAHTAAAARRHLSAAFR